MRVYLASSWRNAGQAAVLEQLRAAGHEVYDFRNPRQGVTGFGWRQCEPTPPPWSAKKTISVLNTQIAAFGLGLDFDAMVACDALVMLQPCGRSAALELGWAIGAGKKTIVLLADGQEPELMIRLAHHLCVSVEEVIERLAA